jgi:acyl-coenzyme A thioesterase PaaI-like protein
MAYLDNTEITVDAILTKKGRQKLASGQSLNISKFALADDEIDYTLYEPAHPKGSAYYDSAIRAIPVTEASPDETQVLRYKLVTLPKGTTQIPTVKFGITSITANQTEGGVGLTPTTSPAGGNSTGGYTVVLADQRAGTIVVTMGSSGAGTIPVFLGDEITTTAQVVSGMEFRFTPNPNLTIDIATTLTVYGNETGGSETIPVNITYKQTV